MLLLFCHNPKLIFFGSSTMVYGISLILTLVWFALGTSFIMQCDCAFRVPDLHHLWSGCFEQYSTYIHTITLAARKWWVSLKMRCLFSQAFEDLLYNMPHEQNSFFLAHKFISCWVHWCKRCMIYSYFSCGRTTIQYSVCMQCLMIVWYSEV